METEVAMLIALGRRQKYKVFPFFGTVEVDGQCFEVLGD